MVLLSFGTPHPSGLEPIPEKNLLLAVGDLLGLDQEISTTTRYSEQQLL